MSVAVVVASGSVGYRAAVAELPLSTHESSDAGGAIVVVDGDLDWCGRVHDALRAGAAAVVVTRPATVPVASIHRLTVDAGPVPVILERPLLRTDVVADTEAGRQTADTEAGRHAADGAPPRLITVACGAPPLALAATIRDAIGWVRVMTGGAPVLRSGDASLALWDAGSPDGPPAVLSVIERGGEPWIRVDALGDVRSSVVAGFDRTTVTTTSDTGETTAPARFETPERLAVRRALAALTGTQATTDLAELAADAALATRIASSASA